MALKPHPLDRQHSLLGVTAALPVPVLGVIDDNTYRLMALPEIAAILTVNSGVAYEAPYFGKQVHTLVPLPIAPGMAWRRARPGGPCSPQRCGADPDFWRSVLAPHAPVSRSGRHAPAAETEPAADRPGQLLELSGDRYRPRTADGTGGATSIRRSRPTPPDCNRPDVRPESIRPSGECHCGWRQSSLASCDGAPNPLQPVIAGNQRHVGHAR